MQKTLSFLLLILIPAVSLSACGNKKSFHFTGRENAQQAFAKCIQFSTKKRFQQAIDCLEIFKNRFPESEYVLDAELRVGDAYYLKKNYLLAAETYRFFTKLHPTSEKLDYAYYRIGLSYLHATSKKIDRDQEHLPEAIDSFAIVFNQFPNSPYARMSRYKYDEARKRVARRHFYIGRFYYKWGEYKAAIPRFQEVYRNYSNLGLDEEALYYTAMAYHNLGKSSEAIEATELLKAKFPESKKTKKATKKMKEET